MYSTKALDWKEDRYLSEEILYLKAESYLFDTLGLSKEYFTGEKKIYRQYKCQLNLSGGAEWFEPTYGIAYSLKHKLSADQMKEHTILYHGVKSNSSIKSIFATGLKAGQGQAYKNRQGKNPQRKVPEGIYSSQFMNSAFAYVDQSFPLIFQIAAPSQIITSRKDYIVIQQAVLLKIICCFKNAPRQQLQ